MIIYKTLDEIKKIKKANEIIARLFEDVLPKHVKAGISTYELDQIAEDYIRSQGAIPGTKGMTEPAIIKSAVELKPE